MNNNEVNTLLVTVTNISSMDKLNLVTFVYEKQELFMISLALQDIKVNQNVILSINPTHINLAKSDKYSISSENILKAKITYINQGKLLSYVRLDVLSTSLESLISTQALQKLELKMHQDVFIFFNASDISIKEVL